MDVQIIQIEYEKYNKHSDQIDLQAHNGEQISLVSLSPNGKYVVTYSYNDNSIEGWDVVNSKLILTFQKNVKLPEESGFIDDIKINNSKIVCYVLGSETNTFQMPNIESPIELNPPPKMQRPRINFTKDGNLAIFDNNKILVYSTDGKMKSSHELLSHNEVIRGVSIDENDNIWVISPNYLFHLDLKKFRLKFSYSLGFTAEVDKRFTVISKGNSVVVKYNNEIAIFSEGVHFPIKNIKDTNIKKIELCKIQNNDYLLAFNLPEKQDEKYEKQNIFLYHIIDIKKQPIDVSKIFNKGHSEDKFYEYNSDLEKAFGLVNGEFSCINIDFDQKFLESHEVFFESHRDDDDLDDDDLDDDDFVSWNNYLCWNNYLYQGSCCNDTLAFPDMKNLRLLVSNDCKYIDENKDINFENQKYKWRIDLKNKKLSVIHADKDLKNKKLSVNADQGILDSKNLDDNSWNLKWNWKILNNNALALRYYGNCTGDTVIIYNYNIKKKKIKIEYYYKKGLVKLNKEEFSKSILPIATDLDKDKIKIISNIISNIIEDDRCLAKYGQTLLPILIESSDSDLTRRMEDIYKKCMKLVKENPKRNLKFLNIITSSMNKLYKSHFDYITKFNSEMFMILDPFNESVNNEKEHSHFHTFSQEAIIATGYSKFFKPFHSLISYDLMNNLRNYFIEKKAIQYITLIVPYVDYSRYPSEYSFLNELFYPPSSVFTKTCKKKEFYTNWNDLSAYIPATAASIYYVKYDQSDPNNPWTLSNTYNQTDENGNILNASLIQIPSENTNLFYSYPTSLLATYLFLTGNQNSFSPWTPKLTTEYTTLFGLMAIFSFLVVIYLMNLFIGLLDTEIGNNKSRAKYLAQKAEVIAEIELLYLLPHQRRRRTWFPEVIYYRVDVEKARKHIRKAIKKGEWKMNDWPEMKHKILKLLSMDNNNTIVNQAV
ncbi:hypothetical protein RhiirA1_436022 [Rhizophagus irregularis]|uniref:Ion transport domain-containing protein n=1 Tax=Rhizophagus irregularis TaxID=588596 RepID=A0A2N0SJY4_9GLOM|nr:hypothetical protein RhiirA1_436022 [Rhizophagus irregularis]